MISTGSNCARNHKMPVALEDGIRGRVKICNSSQISTLKIVRWTLS